MDRYSGLTPKALNKVFKDRYANLSEKTIVNCRYFSDEPLRQLKILKNVMALVRSIGFETFINITCPAYKEVTLEFLSTLRLFQDPDSNLFLHFTFRFKGKDYKVTMNELNDMFGFDNNGLHFLQGGIEYNKQWHRVSKERKFVAGRSKESSILRPSYRYFAKLLNSTILATDPKNSTVTKSCLELLYHAGIGVTVRAGEYMIQHMVDVAHKAKGTIMVGGLITHIVQTKCGVDLQRSGFEMVGLIEKITLSTLKKMFLINPQLEFLDPNRKVMEKEPDFTDESFKRPGLVHEEDDNDVEIPTTEGGEPEAAMDVDPSFVPEEQPQPVHDQQEIPSSSHAFEENVPPPFVPPPVVPSHVEPQFQAGSSSSIRVPYTIQEPSSPLTTHGASSSSRVEDKLDAILLELGRIQRTQKVDHETLMTMQDRQILMHNEMVQLRSRVNTMQYHLDDFRDEFELRFQPPPS